MSQPSAKGGKSARRLAAAMQTKLARCQWRRGRTCCDSQQSSLVKYLDKKPPPIGEDGDFIKKGRLSKAVLGRRELSTSVRITVFVTRGAPRLQEAYLVDKPGCCSRIQRSGQLSCDGDDLADYFSLQPVSQSFRAAKALGVGMNDQNSIFRTATGAKVRPISFEHDIYRLLP